MLLTYHIEYTFTSKEVLILAKFTPQKPEKEVISLRLAISTLEDIDRKAAEIGISRNELINQMIVFALSSMDDGEN